MKHFFLLALLATPFAIQAQNLTPGTVALGGSINYYNSSGTNTSSSSNSFNPGTIYSYSTSSTQRQFGVNPALSYFVAENLALGLSVSYTTAHLRQESINISSPSYTNFSTRTPWRTYSAGVFGQYYKMLNAQFGFTGQLSANYTHSTESTNSTSGPAGTLQTNSSSSSNNGYYLNLTPGIIFFPTNRLGITLTGGALSFSHIWSKSSSSGFDAAGGFNFGNSEATAKSLTARFGFDQLYLGGAYYFGR